MCTALLAMSGINDKQLDPSHRKDSSSTQQPIAALQTLMQMLAIASRFARMAHQAYGAPGRYFIIVLCSGVLAGMSSLGVAVTVCLVGYLLACGDVQPNPGPGQSSEDGTELQNGAADSLLQAHNNQTFFDRLHADMAHTMNQAVSRTETATQQQENKIEERLGSVEDKIDRRLCEVETRQTQLANCMDSLHSECQALRSDNQDLRGTVNYLTEKCDYMENQSRRNNLVFTGFASVREGFESWEDCERKGKACVKEGMGITERLEIDRAHRAGKAIVVRFLSYKQKMLVLTNARKLKTSNGYDVYVREDFSETVQKKRQALMTLQRELRPHSAKLRFDKLITEDSMYTCDLFNDRIMRHNRRDKQPAKNPDVPRHEERVRQSGRSWEGGVPETFIVERLLIHDQQRSHNTGLDHHRTLQTTCCNLPSSLLCVQCGIQVPDSQTRTPLTAATPAWRPPKAAGVLDRNSSAMPFQQRGKRGTTRHTAHVGCPRQASQPLTD